MKKLLLFIYATTIDFVVAILCFLGGAFISMHPSISRLHEKLSSVMLLLIWVLIALYLLCSNTKRRSLGFIFCSCKYLCKKGKWRIVLANFIYYALLIIFIYTRKAIQFSAGILLLIDYIGFFVVNNRFSLYLLDINFEKSQPVKKDKICI